MRMIPQYAGQDPALSLHPDVVTKIRHAPVDVVTAYEAGDVVAFPSIGTLPLDSDDWAFINALKPPLDADKSIKKAKMKHVMIPVGSVPDGEHVLNKLGIDARAAEHLQGIISRVNAYLISFARLLFPSYRFLETDSGITWRFTVTESEEMHYDSYGGAEIENHHVRLFLNLDDRPRLWGIGNPVTRTLKIYRDRLAPYKHLHPNILNNEVNSALPWVEVPRHYAMFMPGNAWLVNSQLVAHEIIYGRKMVACTFEVDPRSMQDPSKSFNAKVRSAAAQIWRE